MASKKSAVKSKTREYVEAIVIAVVLALLIRAFVVQAFKIPSGSMLETLQIGDHILVNKFTYGINVPFTNSRVMVLNQPRRGDIIVFSFPKNKENPECTNAFTNISGRISNVFSSGNPFYLFKDDCRDFIKRVIGVGGDRIEVIDKKVYVNDVALDEPYTIHKDPGTEENIRDNFGPFIVPHNSFFVMGDNRDESYDSRFWGVVDLEEIKGRAFIMYWSWNGDGAWYEVVRWNRIGKLLH